MARNLVRFDPFAGLESLRRDFFDDDVFQTLRGKMPTTDVYTEDDKMLVIEAHLPNFDEKDVTVSIDQGTIVIQAERHEQEKDKKKEYVIRESSSSFYRRIALPEQVEEGKVKAAFHHGVLRVTVPLKELTAPTKVPISAGGAP